LSQLHSTRIHRASAYSRTPHALFFLFVLFALRARPADTVLVNGHVFTEAASNKWAQAVAITGDHIEAVGNNEEISKRKSAGTTVIDLQGKTVIPGITDGHVHLWFGALALHGFNLATPESTITPKQPELLVQKVKQYASTHPNEPIVYGRIMFITEFTASGFQKPTVTKALLDRAVPDRPVVVHDFSEHALWVNSKTLQLAHIGDKHYSDPAVERNVFRDAQGHPTGVLMEAAMELVEQALPDPPLPQKMEWIAAAEHYLNSFGVTSATMATGNLADIQLYAKMRDQGKLTLRTRTAFGAVAVNHHLTPQFLDDLETARSNYHDKWVRAGLVKFFSDGLSDPPVYTPPEFQQLVLELDKRGYQLMTHSLGTDSAQMVLDAYQLAEKVNGTRDRRFRMEHADTLTDSEVARFHPLSVIASMQPSFCCMIGNYGNIVYDGWNKLLKTGAMLTFSSDWPCTWPPDPLEGIREAASRAIQREVGPNGPVGSIRYGDSNARISVTDAVTAYTRNAAFANFADKDAGTIETGKLADLVVLTNDIFNGKAQDLAKAKVFFTMVGGKVVYHQ
jgi:predicted amidohydrolase YtcJ